jgi:hypothetical protein
VETTSRDKAKDDTGVAAAHRAAPPRRIVPWIRRAVLLLLVATPLAVAAYKIHSLGYSLADVLPRTQYHVTYDIGLDGYGSDVRVRTFLPVSDAHQTVSEEQDAAAGFQFVAETAGLNRMAVWSGTNVGAGARIRYGFTVVLTPLRFDLDPDLPLPVAYPASLGPYLRPEDAIQVDAPEIGDTAQRIGADQGSVTARLRAIYEFTAGLRSRAFKGTTDALTALRLGEASCNGKSRLFVALARAVGIPARLVGGLILSPGSKRTSHQWLEAWVAGHWVPVCPTNHHFAELPERYLTLYYGDEVLFQHTADINFNYRFTIGASMVPSPAARRWAPSTNVWALFERLGLSFALLRVVLMVVVLFRNVVGLPTFGTFLPALLAAAAGETGALWGVIAVVIVVGVVALVRGVFHRLQLLHSPLLAILLAAVSVTILVTSLLAERFGRGPLVFITVFPIAVLAITAERFYLALAERGAGAATRELAGTLAVMLGCYLVMNSLALQALVIGFPEVLLLVVAANVYLGRWVGVRLVEYVRFRRLVRPVEGR